MNWHETLSAVPTPILRRELAEREGSPIDRDAAARANLDRLCDWHKVTRDQMFYKNRGSRETCLARDAYCSYLRHRGYTVRMIGEHLGRNHGSVVVAAQRHNER